MIVPYTILTYILIGILAAFLNTLINYVIGKPGSDKFSPYEIFAAYTVWLSVRRLKEMQLYDKYIKQYNENAERLTSKSEAAKFHREFQSVIYDAADPYFTWERAVGMCPVCTGFWVSLGVGLVFTFNFVALGCIVVTSHVVIRILSKII